jgi:hypothetical protein
MLTRSATIRQSWPLAGALLAGVSAVLSAAFVIGGIAARAPVMAGAAFVWLVISLWGVTRTSSALNTPRTPGVIDILTADTRMAHPPSRIDLAVVVVLVAVFGGLYIASQRYEIRRSWHGHHLIYERIDHWRGTVQVFATDGGIGHLRPIWLAEEPFSSDLDSLR